MDPDFKTMTQGDLLNYCGDDAGRWAKAFAAIRLTQRPDVEEGDMIAWFSNVIEVSHLKRVRSAQRLSSSEAVFGLLAWLTCRNQIVTLSARHDAGIAARLADEFCKTNDLPTVRSDYHLRLTHPSYDLPADNGAGVRSWFCTMCFTADDNDPGHCLACGAGNAAVLMPQYMIDAIRSNASTIGRSSYPTHDDRARALELTALRSLVKVFHGRSARRVLDEAGNPSGDRWWVEQRYPDGPDTRTVSICVTAASEQAALDAARTLLPYVPAPS